MLNATPALEPRDEARPGRREQEDKAMYRLTDEPLFRLVLGLIGTVLSAGITLTIMSSSPIL
jgi:hypothetical protein